MTIFEGMFTRATKHGAHPPRDPALVDLFAGENSLSGLRVTPDTALQATAVYAAVQLLSEVLASLPLFVYRRRADGGRERDTDHPLHALLHDQPNPWQTSYEWREMMEAHLELRGNAYSEIIYNGGGRPIELHPLHPDRVYPLRASDGKRAYRYTPDDGGQRILMQREMLHLPGLSFNGLRGLNPIEHHRETIGRTMAATRYSSAFFGNGTAVGSVLTTPNSLTDKARKNIIESIERRHRGVDQAHRLMLLEEDLKPDRLGMSMVDAQFIEQEKFSISDIARIFHRIPPHMIGDLDRSTNNNIEQQSIQVVVYTMRPIFVRWEQALARDLLSPAERRTHFIEFAVDGLLRGDVAARGQWYRERFMTGSLSPNDIRRLENENPVEGGDQYFVPLNMVPADQAAALADLDGMSDDVPPDDDEGDEEDDDERAAPGRELRSAQRRSVASRRRLQRAFAPLFRSAVERVLRREITAARKAARKMLGERAEGDFLRWLEQYYEEHFAFVRQVLSPIVRNYAEAIAAEASAELGGEPELDDDGREFVDAYTETLAKRHVAGSKNQLRALVNEGEGALERVEQRLSEWSQKRAAKVTANEVVQAGAAVAVVVYRQLGVRRLRWVTVGDDCPMCDALDGRVVAIEQEFLGAGDTIKADGAAPLTARTAVRHPPLHQGCDCQIVAE